MAQATSIAAYVIILPSCSKTTRPTIETSAIDPQAQSERRSHVIEPSSRRQTVLVASRRNEAGKQRGCEKVGDMPEGVDGVHSSGLSRSNFIICG